jgi:ribosomal protein S12 methylthiotransferase
MINLGCARNLVDAQAILGSMKSHGHKIVDIKDAQMAVVNTCGFIEDAKKESIDTILDLLELKKKGKIQKVIVAGCLAQRYGQVLAKELKGVDAIVGVQKLSHDNIPQQVSLTPRYYAFLKICESCYNRCSFCVIPAIKGKFISRTIESVVREARQLDERGVKEINIIGQDITAYGMDLYREKMLARLLREMCRAVNHIRWIRLLYTFPAHVTDELIDTIAQEEKICKYIDIPLQHISDNLLSSMNRGITTQQTRDLIRKIRDRVPKACLRTTFIVGLPGETQENFEEMVRFVQEAQFDKLGVFTYSREEGTPAYDMPHQVPEDVKKKRLDILMKVQKEISQSSQKKYQGEVLDILIDEKQKGEDGMYLGRTQYDAPEVDGVVYVHSRKELNPGDIVAARVTDSLEYDLRAEALS